MVLGVAFVSITIQAAFLSSYIRRNLATEHVEHLDVRLTSALAVIESLQKLREDEKTAAEAFVLELEKDKDKL